MKCTSNYRWLLVSGASVLALSIGAPLAIAQAGPAADSDRDVVLIVGQTIEETLPQDLSKYGSDLEVIDSVDIRNNVYVDAQQAMQMQVPGLFVNPAQGPFSYMDISLQGSRTQDMMLTVDGVRINNRLYSTTMSDTLPAAMIERIEVLKGGQSLFYGTQAASGVINFVTRGYTDDFNGQVSAGGDTNNGLHLDGYVRGKAGPGNYVAYASRDVGEGFDIYTQYAPSQTDHDRSYDVNTYGAKYRFELGDNLAIDARYHHADAKNDNLNPRRLAFSKNVRDEDVASVSVDYQANDWAQFLVKGYWHDWDSKVSTINNVLQGGTGPIIGQVSAGLDVFWGFEDKGINALAKLTPGGPFEYLVGYDYQQYSGKDDFLLIAEREEEVNAFFGQVRSTDDLIKNASFAAGIRHSEGQGASITVWNASGRYQFTPYLYAEANIGTSFLLPTAEQLYAIEVDEIGNPNLEAEESEAYNIGLGGQFGAGAGPMFSWQATYFSRDTDNLIGFEDCLLPDNSDYTTAQDCALLFPDYPVAPDPDTSTPFNENFDGNGFFQNTTGTVEVRGFELTGVADFQNGFTATASYTDSETTDPSGLQRARVPRRYGKIGGAYDAGQWGVNASGLWVGEVNTTSIAGGIGVVNYGDYFIVDLAAHFFVDADQKHKLTARVQNVFDEDYFTAYGRSAAASGDTTAPFGFGTRGMPQTLYVTYSYGF
ncbi:MAG: TonB-dependent receptor [Hyphomonadaceae bacterium]